MRNLKYTTELIHISTVSIGDTVIHNNELATVNKENIKRSDFMGVTLFGDSYRLGTKKVIKVNI